VGTVHILVVPERKLNLYNMAEKTSPEGNGINAAVLVPLIACVAIIAGGVVYNRSKQASTTTTTNTTTGTKNVTRTNDFSYTLPAKWSHTVYGGIGKVYDIYYDNTKYTEAQALQSVSTTAGLAKPSSGLVVINDIDRVDVQQKIDGDITTIQTTGHLDKGTFVIYNPPIMYAMVRQSGDFRLAQMKVGKKYYAVALCKDDSLANPTGPVPILLKSFR
jgi:hypothetical protein